MPSEVEIPEDPQIMGTKNKNTVRSSPEVIPKSVLQKNSFQKQAEHTGPYLKEIPTSSHSRLHIRLNLTNNPNTPAVLFHAANKMSFSDVSRRAQPSKALYEMDCEDPECESVAINAFSMGPH